MSDWWGTRAETDEWGSVKPGTGLAGFLSHPDTGSEIGDRLGVISQILMNLGSGRGGAGIGEAVAGASERSTARREKRHMTTMANRMADKLEPSNPELANMIRANPEFGLQLAGKQALMPMEYAQEEKLARMRGDIDYEKAAMLADRKAAADREGVRLRLAAMFGGEGQTQAPAGEIQATPLNEISTVPASVSPPAEGPESLPPASSAGGVDYTVGLTDIPGLRERQLHLRQQHDDPELPIEDVQLFLNSAYTGTVEGEQKALSNIAARKQTRQRTAEFAAREKAFNVAPQGPSLPGDKDMPEPGGSALLAAGINPITVPPEQQQQQAEFLRRSYKVGDKEYNDALQRLLPSREGLNIEFDPVTGKPTSITQGGAKGPKAPSESQAKAVVYYDQAVTALGQINSDEATAALTTPSFEAFNAVALPNGLANIMASDEFSVSTKAALGFVEAVVRYKSGAQITPSELEANYQIFIPQVGDLDKPKTLAFKRRMRERITRAIGENRSIDHITREGYEDLNEAMKEGFIEPGEKTVPPMPEWAVKADITPEQWAEGTADLWFPSDQEPKKQ